MTAPLDPPTLMAALRAGPVAVATLHNVSLSGADRCDLTIAGGVVTGCFPPTACCPDRGRSMRTATW